MADTKLYYYNGDWRSFDYLHDNYGITFTQSTPTNVYDNSLNSYTAWIDNDTGDNDHWVVDDNQWYSLNVIPYWIKLEDPDNVYLIDQSLDLDEYRKQSSEMYVYNGELQSFEYMYNNFGITHTPSAVYYIKNGIIKCWYNSAINKYWDVDTARWYNNAPDYSGGGSGDIDSVGASGLFLYYSPLGQFTPYGTLVNGSLLVPISISMPLSGDMSCQRHTITLTGTWKILTEVAETSSTKPCIVFATKVSDIQ